MPLMMKLTYCGNDCNLCPRFMGTKDNNTDELKRAAEMWLKVGWRERVLSPDEMKCYGCSSAEWCRYEIEECCEEKNIDNCGYCNNYPCNKINEVFKESKEYEERSKTVLSNSEYGLLKKAFYMKKERLNKIKNAL